MVDMLGDGVGMVDRLDLVGHVNHHVVAGTIDFVGVGTIEFL